MKLVIVKPMAFFSWMKITLVLMMLIFSGSDAMSQDFKKRYRKAKELFEKGSYSEAMEAFNRLTVYDKDNPYAEYASYYHAISAQRLGFNTLAKSQLSDIRKIYPHWDQLDEVNLWLAKLLFDQGDFFQAMLLINQIKNSSLTPKTDSIKRQYLSKLDDVETIRMLREENPNDVEVDRALAKAIGAKSIASIDSLLFDSLISKYTWKREEFIPAHYNRTIKRDRYRVALLFPFRATSLEPSPEKKKNQPILDLYQGIKLAVDTLNKIGVKIELLAYDTERDPETTKQILTRPELASADLLIGPLFADDAKEVQSFSLSNEINLIANPVSNNSDFLEQNPFSFLYQPSHETIGIKSAELVASHVTNKNAIVYYGESPKDSVMAFNFIKQAIGLGIKVVHAEEVRKETSAKIFEQLAKATEFDEWKNPLQFKMKKDSIGSIFVASDDPVIYTKVINSVETRGDSILLIGQESWLEDNTVDLGKFENSKIVFVSPNFCSVTSKKFIRFRAIYMKKHGLIPPDNAVKGYEMMMTIGKALHQYGTYFQDNLLSSNVLIEGTLTPGYLLQPSRDNGLVPFVRFRRGELHLVKTASARR
jgi:tetratricopeptide (TPR) repeat protein